MTPAADLRASALLAAMTALIAACGGQRPPSADYVAWCQSKFSDAEDLVDSLQRAMRDRLFISIEDYERRYGEVPSNAIYRLTLDESEPSLVMDKAPDHLAELEELTNRVHWRLVLMSETLKPDTNHLDDLDDTDSTLSGLDRHDQETRYRNDLINSGKLFEDPLPELEKCFRRLQ